MAESRLDKLPVEVVNEIVSSLNLRDLKNLEDVYNFDYYLFDLPGSPFKSIDAQKAFSDYDLFLKYRQHYQRIFLTHKEIRLALNGGNPLILDYLYRENHLPFDIFLATLVIHGQNEFLENLVLRDFIPLEGSYPLLIVAGVIYLTWGTYEQVKSFFTRYTLSDFKENWLESRPYEPGEYFSGFESWLNGENNDDEIPPFPHYLFMPLFPYHCTDSQYSKLLGVNWLPHFFQQKISPPFDLLSIKELSRNLLFFGRDAQLFQRIVVYEDISPFDDWIFQVPLLAQFNQIIPILGQPLMRIKLNYQIDYQGFFSLPYHQFRNQEALWIVLEHYRSYFEFSSHNYLHTIRTLNNLIKHAIASNDESLFTQLWDYADGIILENPKGQFIPLNPEESIARRNAQLVDACLSVDNPFFFEECQRRIVDLDQLINSLVQLLDLREILFSEDHPTEQLIRYLFTYHRSVAFDRIKSSLGLDLLAQVSIPDLAQILAKGFHYGTLVDFLRGWTSIDKSDWESLVVLFLTSNPVILEESSQEIANLTWATDQPLFQLSDLVLNLFRLIPLDKPVGELFFGPQVKETSFLKNLIYADGAKTLDLLYHNPELGINPDLRIDMIRRILRTIIHYYDFLEFPHLPVNLVYTSLEILKRDSPSDFKDWLRQIKLKVAHPEFEPSDDDPYLTQPGLHSFLNYLETEINQLRYPPLRSGSPT